MKSALVVVLLAVFSLAKAAVHKVPLVHHESFRTKLIREGKWADFLKQRNARGPHNGLGGPIFAPLHGSTPLIDYADQEYLCAVTVGTPPQSFMVICDTGNANFWVTDISCQSGPDCGPCFPNSPFCQPPFNQEECGGSKAQCCQGKMFDQNPCAKKRKFNSTKSSTYTKNGQKFKLSYGDGDVDGFLGVDKVCITPGLCTPHQTFGQANQLPPFLASDPSDGNMGLAFNALSMDHLPTPFSNIMNSLDKPLFTVWMTHLGNVQGKAGGQITYGAYDTTNCNMDSIQWVPLVAKSYWAFNIDSVSFAGSQLVGAGVAISVTGGSLIAGPQVKMDDLCNKLGGTYDSKQQIWYIGCNANPGPVTFTINKNDYGIQAPNYIIPAGNGKCILAFQGFYGGGIDWILGTVFIRQYCNVYDMGNGGRIGFAYALH